MITIYDFNNSDSAVSSADRVLNITPQKPKSSLYIPQKFSQTSWFDLKIERYLYSVACEADLPTPSFESADYFRKILGLPFNAIEWLKFVKLYRRADELGIGYERKPCDEKLVFPIGGINAISCYKIDFPVKALMPSNRRQAYAVVKLVSSW